jgi:hypothetical protein
MQSKIINTLILANIHGIVFRSVNGYSTYLCFNFKKTLSKEAFLHLKNNYGHYIVESKATFYSNFIIFHF